MNIKIRKASIRDLVSISKLNHLLCLKENQEFDPTINSDYPLQKGSRDYFIQRINKDCALVAMADGKIAGYLVGSIIAPEDYRVKLRIAEAENMLVLEEFRGEGIGKKLFAEFVKWSRANKADRVRAVASAGNDRAIDFYRREGLVDYNLTLEKDI